MKTRAIGGKVHYIAYEGAKPENGMIKSVHPTNPDIIYVVYKCGGDWKRFKEFTAQATFVADLREGWVE